MTQVIDRRSVLAALSLLAAGGPVTLAASAARARVGRTTMRHVTGGSINTLDPTMLGSTRESFGLSMSVYDRLMTFGRKPLADGMWTFDPETLRGELAERCEVSDDQCTITLHLRPDAVWHDGTPVTAEDIKWSLDRCVQGHSLAVPQFTSGSMTSPDQFRIVGEHMIQITLPKPDRLAVANLAMPYAIMINSRLARRYATHDDPWAQQWLQHNTAAGGAYRVDSFRPGINVSLTRNDAWKSTADGSRPFFEHVISQTVPEATARASLVERGDADIAIDLQAYDIIAMAMRKRVKISSIVQSNCFTHLAFDTQRAPFDNVLVRRAIAAALPYDDMFAACLFGRGQPLYGARWHDVAPDISFPQSLPLATDLPRARALMAEAGYPQGFETTFSYTTSQTTTAEPMAALVQEALGKIGIKVRIDKLPDATFNTMQAKRELPFYTDTGAGWIERTYYFFYLYFTRDQRWNFSNWRNMRMVSLIEKARFEIDEAAYEQDCRDMISLLIDQVPLVMLWQPKMDAVSSSDMEGFTYQYYRQVDFRTLSRA